PRDKAKVEVAVLVVERWILARLRNQRFFSLVELNAAIRVLVDELNARLMRKLGASRREFFETIDRPALMPSPAEPYQYAACRRACWPQPRRSARPRLRCARRSCAPSRIPSRASDPVWASSRWHAPMVRLASKQHADAGSTSARRATVPSPRSSRPASTRPSCP